MARGQTSIPITGPSPVCKGNTGVYSITPTSGLTYYWSVSLQGNISSTTPSSATVLWGLVGTGTLNVAGLDSAGDTVQKGTLNVVIAPLPTPYLTNNAQVACQVLDSLRQKDAAANNTVHFNDTGCIKMCSNSTVTFTAHGFSGSTFTWAATGAASISPSGSTCNITWGAAGAGSVTITETTSSGCKATKTICITIIDHPHAQFYVMPNPGSVTICDSATALFIDQSTPSSGSSIVSWRWDFGDGTFSNAQGSALMPVAHQYNHPGSYTATLTVTNECGCTDQYRLSINVQAVTGVKIYCPHVACQNDTASYTSSLACSPSAWRVVGGTIQATPPITPGTVNIRWDHVDTSGFGYIMYNGGTCSGRACNSMTVVKIPVVLTSGHIVGPKIVCAGNQIIYRLPQWPTTKFTWSVSSSTGATTVPTDQPNEIALNTGNTSGTITLSCTYQNTLFKCGGSASITIQVLPPATINGASTVCYNTTNNYSLSGGLSGNWVLKFPDGSQNTASGTSMSALFNQVGTYTLTVAGSTFCPPSPFNIRVDSLPHKPDFIHGPNTLCKGVQTEFDAGNPVPGTIFAWAVQNGSVNSGSGAKTFVELNRSSTGPFVVMVWREGANAPHCHSDTLTMAVDTPKINLSIAGSNSVCPSSNSTYTASYTGGETYSWSLSNPNLGSVQNNGSSSATILWNNASGTCTVNLIMTKCFSTYTASYTVTVNAVPTVTLSVPDTVCSASAFTASVSYGGTGVTFNWGNGASTSVLPGGTSATYTYPVTGSSIVSYTVSANVTTSCGTVITVSKVVYVKPAPVANITPDGPFSYCPPNPFSQVLTATINSGFEPVNYYYWYKDNVLVASGPSTTTYTATSAGNYWLVVQGPNGCTNNSDTVQVVTNCGGGGGGCSVTPTPVLTVTAALDTCGYVHTTGAFTGSGVYDHWTYPIQTVTAATTSSTGDFTFNKAGNYTFTYSVNYSGCVYSQSASVIVPYIAGVKYAIQCNGSGSTYKANVYDNSNFYPSTPITNYTVKINGSTVYSGSTAPNYNTNLAPGTYNVEEDISGGSYPVCRAFATIVVPVPPHASFTVSRTTACVSQVAVFFTNTSTGSGLTYNWQFGDVSSNTQQNPYRVYSSTGNVTPTLTVTDLYGCTSTASQSLTIKGRDVFGNILIAPKYPCEGTAVTLTYKPNIGSTTPNYYYWMQQMDTIANTIYNPIHVFDPGYYWVTAVDNIGCYTNTTPDTVVVTQVPPPIIFGDTSECAGTQFTLSGYAGEVPGLTYGWLLNGSLISGATSSSLSQTLYSTGVYTYRLVLSVPNPGGGFCTDTSNPFNVTVHALPAPPSLSFSIPNCATYEVDLSVSPPLAGSYNWSNGLSGPNVTTYQGGNYQATYTDVYGCVSYNIIQVPKDPKVYLWIFPSGCFTLCVPKTTYDITGPIIPFYSWQYLNSGGPGASGTSSYIPDFTFNNAGQFNLVLNNGYCSATSDPMDVSAGPCGEGKKNLFMDNSDGTMPSLRIVPNPANTSAAIQYSYTGDGGNRYLEVYDMTGRLVSRYRVVAASGSWQLSLDNYASGLYEVIMRQDNKILLYNKLSVIK